nr:hypothetical protein [Tanacetum cinerariifolium]
AKIDEPKDIESGRDDEETESDGESEEEETRVEEDESFDPIPKTLEDSEDDGNNEEDKGLRISEEERIHEEEEADELYRNVDINQGRGLQVSQDIEDSHVTLTPVHSDGQQESSSTSSFVTSLLNPIIDLGMESTFTTGLSSVTPIPSPKSIMTPSIITTTTTASQPPIPPTPIPSDILQTLLTFASVFHFEDRVKSLEVNFSEFMRTNQSPEAVSNIPGIVNQYMHQEMTEAIREAVQIQTDRLQDSLQRENDEFLRTIDDNMSSTDEGTGSKPGVPDVPSNDSDEEILWNSSDDEDVDAQDTDKDDDEGKKNDESDDGKDDNDDNNDNEEEIAKIDEPKDIESGRDDEETESDGESEEEEKE